MLPLYLKCHFTAQYRMYTNKHCTHFSTPHLNFSRVDNYSRTLFYGRLRVSACTVSLNLTHLIQKPINADNGNSFLAQKMDSQRKSTLLMWTINYQLCFVIDLSLFQLTVCQRSQRYSVNSGRMICKITISDHFGIKQVMQRNQKPETFLSTYLSIKL